MSFVWQTRFNNKFGSYFIGVDITWFDRVWPLWYNSLLTTITDSLSSTYQTTDIDFYLGYSSKVYQLCYIF